MNARIHRRAARTVPELVTAGLDRCAAEYRMVLMRPAATHAERAARAERLAVLSKREARWWTVLKRWTYGPSWDIPLIFGRAAILAAADATQRAHLYAGMAADYQRMAAGLPICSFVGCTCGGVCEVPA